MSHKKTILLVSASGGKNFDLARDLKEIVDNVEEVKSKIINLESYDLPLYKPDLENENDVAQKLSAQFEGADGFIFCAPEYNGGPPPILTNAITWVSITTTNWRDGFSGKKAVIATNSGSAGHRFLVAFRSQLEHLGTLVIPKTILVNNEQLFNKESAKMTLRYLIELVN